MQLDPTRWLVSLAGFMYDLIITREWTRIMLAMIPVFLLCSLTGLVLWGKNLDSRYLAQWYSELGDEEIADWETAWAGNNADDTDEAPQDAGTESTGDPEHSDSEDKSPKLSRFSDTLFRRVQLLQPSDRSQFVIGTLMAQRGALEQGKAMLTKVAPDDRRGYAPAHAMLVSLQLMTAPELTEKMKKIIKHHVIEAKRWNNVPQNVLLAGSELCWGMKDYSESIRLLANAAERDPAWNLLLYHRSTFVKNDRISEQAAPNAETHFKSVLAENPKDDLARVQLAELYTALGRMAEAEALLREGAELERTARIARGLSEFYRRQFRISFEQQRGVFSANMQYLDMALRHDPTNPLVGEEIARLAGLQGPNATEEMIDKLREFLTEGKATPTTHAMIAETYLIRKDYARAMPHLEQVVIRLPTQPDALNNLAFVLADLHPERNEEAVIYAQRAVIAAASAGKPNADFYDTLGSILSALGRHKEAVSVFETAIEIMPRRKDFHERVAAEYQKLGNDMMAETHRRRVEKLTKMEQDEAETQRRAKEAANQSEEAEAAANAVEETDVEGPDTTTNSGETDEQNEGSETLDENEDPKS